MDDAQIPQFYVVSRTYPLDEVGYLLRTLQLTPVVVVVISDVHDARLATMVMPQLMRAKDDAAAIKLAQSVALETGLPPLVIGVADGLEAVYTDGRREKLNVC